MKRKLILALLAACALSACQQPAQYSNQRSLTHKAAYMPQNQMPKITGILIWKSKGEMVLVSNGRRIKTYPVDFGFSPIGTKRFQGDGKTPEGTYYIDRKNPNSQFYLSLGISYPNQNDIARARAHGRSPGGDIFIHGQGRWGRGKTGSDWTLGCIATTDQEIKEIYSLVNIGTPVTILP